MARALQPLAAALHTSPGIAALLCIVAVTLVRGVVVRGVQTFMGTADATRWGSIAVWWGLGLALVLCVVVGWPLVWGFAALVSAVGLFEFARVGARRGVGSWVTLYFLWSLHYALVLLASWGGTWSAAWAWALPVAALVLLCGQRIVLDRFDGFVGRVGSGQVRDRRAADTPEDGEVYNRSAIDESPGDHIQGQRASVAIATHPRAATCPSDTLS